MPNLQFSPVVLITMLATSVTSARREAFTSINKTSESVTQI